jgi:hypothetical protein
MDALLAGRGFWFAYGAAGLATVLANPENGGWARWWFVVALAAWPLAWRASALRGPGDRVGRFPPRWAAALRRLAVRLRWPLAVAYGVVAAVSAQRRYDSLRLTVVATVVAFAAEAYHASRLGTPATPGVLAARAGTGAAAAK